MVGENGSVSFDTSAPPWIRRCWLPKLTWPLAMVMWPLPPVFQGALDKHRGMKPCVALSFILASACAKPQLAHTVAEVAATASHRVAPNIVGATTHSPAGAHHYTAGAVVPHPVNPVAPGSAIAPIAYICLLSLTTVDMTVLGFTVLDVANNLLPCQRSSSPPPAAYAPAREKRETKSFTDWQLQYPCTFGDLSAGRAPACRNPVAGRPPLSERLHRLIVLLWGEKGSVLDRCASPLPGSPGGCGVVEPSGRPPSLSGRGLCGVCPTSALLYFCISPAMPPLPLRILSSQMPPTATLSPGIHLRRYHGESLSKKGTYLMK